MPATLDVEAVLSRAADLRAAGSTWYSVAAELQFDVEELKALCQYNPAYRAAYRVAHREVIADSVAEAMRYLRRILRSDDPKAARRAADTLSRACMARMRHRRPIKKDRPPKTDPRLEGLRPEDVEQVLYLSTQTPEERERSQAVEAQYGDVDRVLAMYHADMLKRHKLKNPPPDGEPGPDPLGRTVPKSPRDPSAPTSGCCPSPLAGEGGRASRPGEGSPPEHPGIAAPWYVRRATDFDRQCPENTR